MSRNRFFFRLKIDLNLIFLNQLKMEDISTKENIVFVRDSWGNKTPGLFWLTGNYEWEACIDGKSLGTRKFHIIDVGKITNGNNPYFNIQYGKLYEGDYNGVEKKDRKYITKIKKNSTRYLWAEISIKNKTNKEYYCELFFNYYDDAGQPKGCRISGQYERIPFF